MADSHQSTRRQFVAFLPGEVKRNAVTGSGLVVDRSGNRERGKSSTWLMLDFAIRYYYYVRCWVSVNRVVIASAGGQWLDSVGGNWCIPDTRARTFLLSPSEKEVPQQRPQRRGWSNHGEQAVTFAINFSNEDGYVGGVGR